MNKITRNSLWVLFMATTLISCKNNTPKEAKYIPRDANFVLVLDPQQLQNKLQNGGISMDTLLGRIFKQDSIDTKDKARFQDLKDIAGINWGDKLFVFMTQKTNPDNPIAI